MRTSSLISAALLPTALLAAAPTVTISLPKATIIGSSGSGIVDTFQGIPFAQPPVGNLRLRAPLPITSALGVFNATTAPQACPQFTSQTKVAAIAALAENEDFALSPMGQSHVAQAATSTSPEDCLTLNVQRPSTAKAGSKLPVIAWIYGGGFEFGSSGMTDATNLINASIAMGHPVMYVAMNYRLGGFGFMGGKEIKSANASNLGLLDQRLALEWIQDNIAAFGGDPTKVTIWGESAGAISVWDQLALYSAAPGSSAFYKGSLPFRAAVMDSGSIVPSNPVDCPKAQTVFDTVVKNAGCANATDALSCLRGLPYSTFFNAANSVPAILGYNSVALSYLPRPDGVVLPDSPELLAQAGKYAKNIPFILGDQEDEGTVFSTAQKNISTTADLVTYLSTIFFPDAPRSRVAGLVATYPNNPSAGSPFRTGSAGELYPQYKRIAALLGDITFTITRRAFMAISRNVAPSTPSWGYLATYYHNISSLGTYHGSDVPIAYGSVKGFPQETIQAYYLSFFNTMNPNTQIPSGMMQWPQWDQLKTKNAFGSLIGFGNVSTSVIPDNFRNKTFTFLVNPKNVLRI